MTEKERADYADSLPREPEFLAVADLVVDRYRLLKLIEDLTRWSELPEHEATVGWFVDGLRRRVDAALATMPSAAVVARLSRLRPAQGAPRAEIAH